MNIHCISAKTLLDHLEQLDVKCFTDILYPDFSIPVRKFQNAMLALDEYRERRMQVASHPSILSFGLTNRCNLRCALCATGQRTAGTETGEMSVGLYKEIIDQVCEYAIGASYGLTGDPILHPNFLEMIRYTGERGMITMVSSNFSYTRDTEFFDELANAGIGILHFDIDGMTQKSYAKYRIGGDLALVQKNLASFLRARDKSGSPTKVQVAMLVNRFNELEVDEFRAYCADLGVDKCLVSRMKIDPTTSMDWLPKNSEYYYQNYVDESAYPENHGCPRLYYMLTIDWNGDVLPCCVAYGGVNKVGRADVPNLMEVWNNEFFQSMRAVFAGVERQPKTLCHYCRNRLGSPAIPRVKGTMQISLPEAHPKT